MIWLSIVYLYAGWSFAECVTGFGPERRSRNAKVGMYIATLLVWPVVPLIARLTVFSDRRKQSA